MNDINEPWISTIDIFGNTFYRNYYFGAGDDTGVYWNDKMVHSRETMPCAI